MSDGKDTRSTVIKNCTNCGTDIERPPSQFKCENHFCGKECQSEYRSKKELSKEQFEKMYLEQNMTLKEIAQEVNLSSTTVGRRRDKWGIEPQDNRAIRGDVKFDLFGVHDYPTISNTGTGEEIPVHKLVAISNGVDAEKVFTDNSTSVDHINGCKIDNRPSNIDLKSNVEHGKKDQMRGKEKYTWMDILGVVYYMMNANELT